MHVNTIQKVESLQENDLTYQLNLKRMLQPCDDCVFCATVEVYYDTCEVTCLLNLNDIFNERNGGSEFELHINDHPTTPCKARYTDDEIRTLLGV